MEKCVIGLLENVKVIGEKKSVGLEVLVDTGAAVTSLDKAIAEEIGVGEPVRTMRVKAPATKIIKERPVVEIEIEIGGQKMKIQANLNDRSHMRYPMIIGRNVLRGNFVVDVEKSPDIRKQ
ncbi:MAG: ATP-dependent zinc protease [Candidatus Aenigmarchaeota archaeon]|nr:ATP-dependent zinc protease [Candidatus Aenigmarchaeota archaeon]